MAGRPALPKGMKTFLAIWAGQSVSLVGTGMARFGLLIWAYRHTGRATTLALLSACGSLPFVLASSLAGELVDRWDRRRVLLLADAGSALLSAGLLALYTLGRLALWHLYAYQALTGLLGAFQLPASAAAVTVLVPEEQYGRASGLQSLADWGADVLAPALAGALLALADLRALLLVDLATFAAALGTLAWAHIPRPPASAAGRAGQGDARYGFRYILGHAGLRQLLLIFAGINLLAALTYFGVLPAMVLARGGGSQMALGAVETALGLGGVAGALLLSAWGGPRRRVSGFLLSIILSFLLGDLLLAVGRTVPVWMVGGLLGTTTIPFIVGCYTALWQAVVPPDVQGRVFAARNAVQVAVMPPGYLAGGLLADYLFEPAMRSGGALASLFGPLVGRGPGAGMGLMFLCTGVAGVLVGLSGYLMPALGRLERTAAAGAGAEARRA